MCDTVPLLSRSLSQVVDFRGKQLALLARSRRETERERQRQRQNERRREQFCDSVTVRLVTAAVAAAVCFFFPFLANSQDSLQSLRSESC